MAVTSKFLVPGGTGWPVFGDQMDRENFRTRPTAAARMLRRAVIQKSGRLRNTPATVLFREGRSVKVRFQCGDKNVDVRSRYIHVGHEPARIHHLGQDATIL